MSLTRWLPIAVLGAIVVIAGASLLFSTFMVYDDEGYVLFSLHEFATGGGLYERVFSQYGPFFFVFNQFLHLVGLEFTNTGARLLTFICWLGATGFCGAIVWRATRSTAATVFAVGGVFLHLWPMISEPSHPGGLIAFVTAGVAWLGTHWLAQPRRLAIAVGLAGAGLFLTKINIGIFLFAGTTAWWVLHLDETLLGPRWRAVLAGAMITLLPFALMFGRLELPWVATFAIMIGAAGAAIVLAAASGAEPITRWGNLGFTAAAALVLGIATCAAVIIQGTSARGLLEGVILSPLRHPHAYTAYVKWRVGVGPLALFSLALAIWTVVRPSIANLQIVAVGRLVAAGAFFSGWAFDWPLNTHAFALSYGLSGIWLFVFPLEGERDTQPIRSWLALLTITQALHAFPVAGSQISWGTFLWIPLATIAVRNAGRILAERWTAAGAARILRIAGVAVTLVTIVRCGQYAWTGVTRLRQSDTLDLPGAQILRLPENFTTALRALARNASAHSDVLFSLPGLLSFHHWTDVPPPTSVNATHWFTLLSSAQQDAIQARLAAAPRSAIIVQRNVYDFLVNSKVATETPLTQWLHANYESAFALESYEFWVRKGRRIALLNTALLREAVGGVTPRYQFTLTLAEPALRAVASIELARFEGDVSTPMQSWGNDDAQIFLTAINSAGDSAGPTQEIRLPFDAAGLLRLELRTNKVPSVIPGEAVFYLRNAAGERLAEARLVR